MKQIWIGQCQLKAHAGQLPLWSDDGDEGQGYALVLAEDADEFASVLRASPRLKHYDIIQLTDIELLTAFFSTNGLNPELVQLAKTLDVTAPVILSGFTACQSGVLQPSHEVSPNPKKAYDVSLDIKNLPTAVEVNWKPLLSKDAKPLWAIVDGVNWPEIQALLMEHLPAHACLYATQDVQAQALAPWLIKLELDNPLTYIIQTRPQDSHSLILFQSDASIRSLRDHFRLFTLLWTPADKNSPIYFRFYDPRVLVDLFSALEPWKQTRFSGPVDAFFVPLSPWVRLPEWAQLNQPLGLTEEVDAYQERLLKIAPCDNLPDQAMTGTRSFRINQPEFDRFGFLNTCRQQQSLAISLYQHYQDRRTQDEYLRYAALAPKLGKQYGCYSTQQVKILAQCLVLLGEHFPQAYPEALAYLNSTQKPAYERIELLWQWVPKGLLLQKLETASGRQISHETNNSDSIMDELFSSDKGDLK